MGEFLSFTELSGVTKKHLKEVEKAIKNITIEIILITHIY
jgi:hypothetical protein